MISVIIPTYNEEDQLKTTVQVLKAHDRQGLISQIIVSDGDSTDATRQEAESLGLTLVISPRKGRAAQMNYGAALATGKVLYFLHADTLPPPDFSINIAEAVRQGFEAGCFRLAFDHAHWFLKANCWFTRFNVNAFRFGDQSLFITREKFAQTGGFCEEHLVMEDQDMIRRLRRIAKFKVMQKPVVTSARKYLENGIFKTQGIFLLIYLMYRFGLPQATLVKTYRRLISQGKL